MKNNIIHQQLKKLDIHHLDDDSMATLRQLCQTEQIAQITHIETLISLTTTLSKLTSQEISTVNWLALQNSEQWQATVVALSNHALLKDNSISLQQGSRCLTSTLLVLKNVMEQLSFRTAAEWQQNHSLTTNLNELLQTYSRYFEASCINTILTALKYIDAPSLSDFSEAIEYPLISILINHIDRLDNKYKALCLKTLSLWHLDSSTISDGTATCLRRLFENIATTNKDRFYQEGDSSIFKRALVQSFYALTLHECLEDLTQFNSLIDNYEHDLKQLTSHMSNSEVFCLEAIEKRLIAIDKQALIGGYPVDGLADIDQQKCIIEIDGPHHNQFKQYLIDNYRDKLLSQLGYWVVRIDLAKLPYTGQGEYCETELSFLAHYLKSLHNLECLTYNAEPNSFVKKALAPKDSDELYNVQTDDITLSSPPDESSSTLMNDDDNDQYKQMLKAIAQQPSQVNKITYQGKTTLHMAIQHGSYEDVCNLIDQHQADVTLADTNNYYPLELAKTYGYEAICKKLLNTLNKALVHEVRSKQDRPNKVIKLLKAGAMLNPLKPPHPNILHISIIFNKLATFKKIDANYPNLKYETNPQLKQSALHTAIAYNRHSIAQYIIDSKSILTDFRDKHQRTAFHYAIILNDYTAALMLFKAGVNPTLTYNQLSPLKLAQEKASPQIQDLVQRGLDFLLVQNICNPQLSEVKIKRNIDCLIEAGARTNCASIPQNKKLDKKYHTPLEATIALNKIEVVKHLISQHNVSLNSLDKNKCTPIHYIFDGDIDNGELLDFLLSQSDTAVINAQNQSGNTVLHDAFILGHYHLAEKLIQHSRTRLDLINNNGDTPLHYAFGKRAPSNIIKQMLKRLHDSNQLVTQLYALNKAQKNPLFLALMHGNLDYLKDYNLDFNQPLRTDNLRPIHVAAIYGQLSDLKFLINQGVNIQATDNSQNNLLHYAVFAKQPSITAYLLETHDFNVNTRNQHNATALHFVTKFYNAEISQMLTKKQYKADCTIKDFNDDSPYSIACRLYGQDNVLTALFYEHLIFQLNEAIRHSKDQPELEIEPMLKILLHNSVAPIETDSQQNNIIHPIIHNAASQGLTNTVSYLMRHYPIQMAKTDTKDGTTLLYKAIETNNQDLTQTLLYASDSQAQQGLLQNKHSLVEKAIDNHNPKIMIQLLQHLYTLNQTCSTKVSPSKPINNKKKRHKNKKKEASDPTAFDFIAFLKTHRANIQKEASPSQQPISHCLDTLIEADSNHICQILDQLEHEVISPSLSEEIENDTLADFRSPQSTTTNPRQTSPEYGLSTSPFSLNNEIQKEPVYLSGSNEQEVDTGCHYPTKFGL